jgi:uncharacterized phiE125 gp8 family phage protein
VNWAIKLKTAPTEEPVSTAEAKAQTRVDISDDDTYIDGLITTARQQVEMIAGRSLCTQTWEMVLDDWPDDTEVELPRPPLASVTSISYTDEDGNVSTMDSSKYIVDTYHEPGRIVLKNDASWPGGTLQAVNGVVIEYVAGYGDAEGVPERYKAAIKLLVGHWYEHRLAVSEVRNLKELPVGVDTLLWIDRVKGF